MKLFIGVFAVCVLLVPAIFLGQRKGVEPHKLSAPTYYIVVAGHLEDDNTVRIQGASSLPVGANIAVELGDGRKLTSDRECIAVDERGFFKREVHSKKGMEFSGNQSISAVFSTTYPCKQPPSVLAVVGKKGQYLGNDNYDDKIDVGMEWTPGMFDNPQLYQASGYFGLSTDGRLE